MISSTNWKRFESSFVPYWFSNIFFLFLDKYLITPFIIEFINGIYFKSLHKRYVFYSFFESFVSKRFYLFFSKQHAAPPVILFMYWISCNCCGGYKFTISMIFHFELLKEITNELVVLYLRLFKLHWCCFSQYRQY